MIRFSLLFSEADITFKWACPQETSIPYYILHSNTKGSVKDLSIYIQLNLGVSKGYQKKEREEEGVEMGEGRREVKAIYVCQAIFNKVFICSPN